MPRKELFLLAALVLAFYLFLSSRTSLFERDEARFARAAVEMARSGNYLYATFNGYIRPDKPILIYWLMQLPLRLLGETTLACRMWAPVGAAVATFLTGLLAWRLWGSRAGALGAALMLATSPLLLISGTAATTDAVLLALVMGSVVSFAFALEHGARPGHYGLLAVLTAATFLLKGPAGLLVPVFVIPVTWLLSRSHTPLRLSYLFGVGFILLFALGCFLAWAIPANIATGGVVWQMGIGKHVVGRAMQPLEGHGATRFLDFPYYVFVVLLAFFPWTLYLPAACSALWRGRLGTPLARPLLLGWIVPIFLLISVVATKLPHYALPIWPALAIAVGGVWTAIKTQRLQPQDILWLKRGVWLLGPVAVLLACGFVALPYALSMPALRGPGLLCAVIIIAMSAFCLKKHLQENYETGAHALIVGMTIFWLCVGVFVLPAVERYQMARPLAQLVNERAGPHTPVVFYGHPGLSLYFYLGRAHVPQLVTPQGLKSWAQRKETGVVIAAKEELRAYEAEYGPLPLERIAEISGYSFDLGKPLTLVALKRPGVRPPEVAAP